MLSALQSQKDTKILAARECHGTAFTIPSGRHKSQKSRATQNDKAGRADSGKKLLMQPSRMLQSAAS